MHVQCVTHELNNSSIQTFIKVQNVMICNKQLIVREGPFVPLPMLNNKNMTKMDMMDVFDQGLIRMQNSSSQGLTFKQLLGFYSLLFRERRRQQLEARQNNLRNSVSGDGSYRDQTTSFRDRTRSMGSFPRERPGTSGTPTRETFWPTSSTACSSPIVQNMPSSHSPKTSNHAESPGRTVNQNGSRMIRPSAWPPHPDREIEDKEIWSPEKTNGLNIFEDVTTEPSLVPYEEETLVPPKVTHIMSHII